MDAETPISKYLAQLERRKSVYVSPSAQASQLLSPDGGFSIPTRPRPGPGPGPAGRGITMRLNFEDESFFQDASMLNISPQGQSTRMSGVKRRRSSRFPWEDDEDVDVEKIQKKNSELERLLRETQAELINVRASQTKLEHLNNELKKNHMEKIIQYEKAEAEMKTKCRNAIQQAENMENQLLKLERKQKEEKENFDQQRIFLTKKSNTLDEKMSSLQTENFQLKQKLTQETMKADEMRRKLQTELSETEMGAEKWVMDSQILKDQLTFAQNQLTACQTELKTVRMDAIKYQEVKDKYEKIMSSNEASASENMLLDELVKKYENLYIKEQRTSHTLAQGMKKLQEENSMLKSTIKQEMILQERITTLETQASYMSEELKEKGACDAERAVLKEELKAWKASAKKIDVSCTTPLNFEKAIRQLQNMLFEFKHENSDLKHNFNNVSRVNSNLQTEVAAFREQVKSLVEDKEKLTGDVKKMSRRLILIVKDRDGLRELKESYEQEFEGLISEPLKARIAQLQEIVAEYERIIKDEEHLKKPCPECEQKNTVVQNLQSQLNETIREKEQLSQTLANQTGGVGDDTTGYKIVAFGNNPSMMTVEARLRECLAENENLKEKLRKYEEDTLVGVTDEALLEEKKKLEDQLRVLERKHEILTRAYDYETVQLQQACSKLFGYHVTLVREPQNQIRLQSTYSTTADHVFIFQEAENNDMMLLETPILEHFRDDIERFLLGEGSIPGFLASVTIAYTQGLGLDQTQTSSMQMQSQSEGPGPSGQQFLTLDNVTMDDSGDQMDVTIRPNQPTSHSQRMGGPGASEVQISIEGDTDNDDEDDEEGDEEEEVGEEEDEYREESEGEEDIYAGLSGDDQEDEEERGGGGDDSDDSDIVTLD